MTTDPDIFRNVHRGIRLALFEACTRLGRAEGDSARTREARATLRDVLQFVSQHGENEDVLIVPLLRDHGSSACERMEAAHGPVNAALDALRARVDVSDVQELYELTCAFTALYLEHVREEEQELERRIRAVLSNDELMNVGRQSVERTPPEVRGMMMRYVVRSLPRSDADAMLGKLPPEVAASLEPLARA